MAQYDQRAASAFAWAARQMDGSRIDGIAGKEFPVALRAGRGASRGQTATRESVEVEMEMEVKVKVEVKEMKHARRTVMRWRAAFPARSGPCCGLIALSALCDLCTTHASAVAPLAQAEMRGTTSASTAPASKGPASCPAARPWRQRPGH